MHAYLILLLAVATLLANSNAATVKLQTSRSFIQSIDAADMRLRSGRLLRTETTSDQIENTDEEERAGITDVAKKFGAGTSQWFKDKTLATKLKFKATQMNLDKTVQKLVEKDTNPDRVYTVLKLHKDSNRYVGWGVQRTGEFRLWEELTAAWKVKYPGWTSQLK
ncbi:hypothetical protein GQ600_27320 [Phytophthora cactorum]|nr:hypothetical protein GQ600_3693 [Phytophthora cactorum]KAF1788801.1 hypothetical protein GQ600_27320 [Phytophthora cactorum]